jgi:Fic-DOC domain mobile mystery protein B
VGLEVAANYGQTPIDEDEKTGLKIPSISTLRELNEFEQLNIEMAVEWSLARRITLGELLSEKFILGLHRRMLGKVWHWAGAFRRTNKNIGVDKSQIAMALRNLLDDCRLWVECALFPPDEIAIRFKHRLVQIHLFPNGNGRHSRLAADIFISKIFSRPVFRWGTRLELPPEVLRHRYITALREADLGNVSPLVLFARNP